MKRDKRLTPEQVQEILLRYPDEKAACIAEDYGVPVSTIYGTAKRYGVKKSEAFRHSPDSGRLQPGQRLSPATQFRKGCQSATKGKRLEAMFKKKESLERWKANWWKQGQKPPNTARDGEIRWRKNPGYYFIRIKENVWELYHRHLWEKQNGPVPAGFNIIFIDGNRRNCKIENLRCISNAELGEMNRHTKYPPELRKAIELKNKLNKTIKAYE
ncbi:MAG: hypothetical protein EOM03_13500 [Clostridia bacterium]|nr:hypothetical protein [Clostridia bacterium]